LAQLLSPASRRTTLLIWLLFFLVMFGFYFVMSLTPKLLVSAGLSAQQGISGGVLLSVGGIFGAALTGAMASRDTEVSYTLQSGPLKNLSLRVNNATNRRSFNSDFDQTRVIVSYPLSL
jgi:hypothetical protein